MLGLNPKDA